MHLLRKILILIGTASLLTACGTTGGDGGPGGGGGGGSLSGTLIGNGTSQVHTWDLSNSDDWLTRLSFSNYDVVALNLPANELYVAGLNMLDPMDVKVYDLNTFGLKHEWLWPDTVDLWRVEGLAISPDGRHAAAILSALGDPFLEVINLETGQIVMTSFTDLSSYDLRWISNTEMMFAMETEAFDTPHHGAIVSVDLSRPMNGEGTEISFRILAGFTEAQWSSVHSYSLSTDGSQLLYSRSSDLWIKDLTDEASVPHQLTTGPTGLTGAAFSPDNSMIAFVEFHQFGLERTFIIPNHRAAPILIDSNTQPGRVWMIEDGNLMEEILVWLP